MLDDGQALLQEIGTSTKNAASADIHSNFFLPYFRTYQKKLLTFEVIGGGINDIELCPTGVKIHIHLNQRQLCVLKEIDKRDTHVKG